MMATRPSNVKVTPTKTLPIFFLLFFNLNSMFTYLESCGLSDDSHYNYFKYLLEPLIILPEWLDVRKSPLLLSL